MHVWVVRYPPTSRTPPYENWHHCLQICDQKILFITIIPSIAENSCILSGGLTPADYPSDKARPSLMTDLGIPAESADVSRPVSNRLSPSPHTDRDHSLLQSPFMSRVCKQVFLTFLFKLTHFRKKLSISYSVCYSIVKFASYLVLQMCKLILSDFLRQFFWKLPFHL